MSYLIISAYTENTPYEQEVKNLKKSLDNLDLKYMIYPLKNRGSWVKNCAQKPEVIYKALNEFPGKDIIWIDADALVLRTPKLFEELSEDIAYYHTKNGKTRLCSGSLFFKNNNYSMGVVSSWIKVLKNNPNMWDQEGLQKVLEEMGILKMDALPVEYCTIKGRKWHQNVKNPVILHTQASRRLRNEI